MIASRGRMRAAVMAGIAALALMGSARADGPSYARIQVSDKAVVYVQAQGTEIRLAMSADDLKTAAPVKPRAEVTLPIPADQLPAGVTAVKATLMTTQIKSGAKTSPYLYGTLTTCKTDDQKAQWQYAQRVGVVAGPAMDSAPAVKLSDLDKLTLKVEGKFAKGKLGVGARLMAGANELTGVLKDGKAVQLQVTVQDSAGKPVATKTGGLSAFGFS